MVLSREKLTAHFLYYIDYSNEELLEKKDEISLVMLINRMQNAADIEEFRKLPAQKVEEILKDTPNHILEIISNILRVFLLKMNLPEEETEELVGKVKEKKMGYLFENMEKMDIQAERRNTAEQRERADKAEERTIQIAIETYQEMGASKEETLQKIQKKCNLSESQAMEKLEKYWPN